MELPDFTPRLLELQAKNTDLEHKVSMATAYLESSIRKAEHFGFNIEWGMSDVEVALMILKRPMT